MSGYMRLSWGRNLRWVLLAGIALLALGAAGHAMTRMEPPAAAAPAPVLPPATAPAGGGIEAAAGDAPAVRVRAALIGGALTEAVDTEFAVPDVNMYGGGRITTRYRSATPAGATGMVLRAPLTPNVEGQKTTHDMAAGLTTVLVPDEATIERIFGGALRAAPEVLGLQRAAGGAMATWGAPRVELLWPEDRPQYFLEQQMEPDLYRRIELREKEGYAVTVRPSGTLPALTVTVELVKNTLTGGTYDETIRAFVGKPTLVQHLLEQVVPLAPGQPVLLVWQPEARVAAAQRDRALAAQQMASIKARDEQAAKAAAQHDQVTAAYAEATRTRTPDHPEVRALQQQITGLERQLAQIAVAGVPAWAVGTWEVRVIEPGGGDELLMVEVKATGELVIGVPEEPGVHLVAVGLDGNPPVSPAGQVRCRATHKGDTISFTGWLHRDGTGAGTARDDDRDEEAVWTARRAGGLRGVEAEAGIENENTTYEDFLRAYPADPTAPALRQLVDRWRMYPGETTAVAGAPPWAVGMWEVQHYADGEPDALFTVEVKANGALTAEVPEDGGIRVVAAGLDGEPPVDQTGRVRCRLSHEGKPITVTGRVHPDGTGGGIVRADGDVVAWTARRMRGQGQAAATEEPLMETGGGGRAPAWAAGWWEVTHYGDGEPDGLFTVEVKANGELTARVEEDGGLWVVAAGLDGKPAVDPAGQVRCRLSHEGRPITLTGGLHRDSTGAGTVRADGESIAWTARRVGRPAQAQEPVEVGDVMTHLGETRLETHQRNPVVVRYRLQTAEPGAGGGGGAPAWAVGEWEVRIPGEGDGAYIAEVQADANITVRVPAEGVPVLVAKGVGGRKAIDASGKVGFEVTHEGTTIRISGRIRPDGTGGGVIRVGDEAAQWTGTRVGGAGGDVLKQTKARLEKELAQLQDALLTGRPEDRETAKVQRRIQELERQLTELQGGRVPGWAAGGWDVHVGEQPVQWPIVITHQGEVSPLTPDFIVQGEVGDRFVDPTGAMGLEITFEGADGAFVGKVQPGGTAYGTVRLEGGETDTWTAARIGDAAPGWAVGEWEMTGPGEERGRLSVKRDATVIWTSGIDRRAGGNDEPPMMYGPGAVDATGQVEIDFSLGGQKTKLSGRLAPDGTASGGMDPYGVAWTAARIGTEATGEAAVAWAPELPMPGQQLQLTFGTDGQPMPTPAGAVQFPLGEQLNPIIWVEPTTNVQPGVNVNIAPPADMTMRGYYGIPNPVGQTVLDGTKTLQGTFNTKYYGYTTTRPAAAPTGVAVLLELVAPEQATAPAKDAACRNNLKQLALGCHMYAEDHEGQLPTAADPEEFRTQILPYAPNVDFFVCPAAPDEQGYVFNPKLAGKKVHEIRDAQGTPMLWDAGVRLVATKASPKTRSSRHRGGDHVAYVDGSCRWLNASDIAKLGTAEPPAAP